MQINSFSDSPSFLKFKYRQTRTFSILFEFQV